MSDPTPPSFSTVSPLSLLQVVAGFLVLLLQLGFQLVEAGSVRSKNTATVFTRGLTCLALSLLTQWVCGYAFAFSPGHYLLGYTSFFGLDSASPAQYSHWFLHASVASLPSTLVAAFVSERSHMTGHLVMAPLLAGLVYPLPAHWVWQQDGWLHVAQCRDVGGVLVVHLTAGVAGLVAILLVGQRVEKMGDQYKQARLPGHSLPLVGMGGMLVIVGMVGKLVGLAGSEGEDLGMLAVNCLLGGAGGGVLVVHLFKVTVRTATRYNMQLDGENHGSASSKQVKIKSRRWSYMAAYNGFLTGMISVSGTGSDLPSWAAFLSGLVGGLFYFLLSGLLRLCRLDDPVYGVSSQLAGGVWGAMVSGMVMLVHTRDGMSLAWQLVGVVAVTVWVAVSSLVVMLPLLVCGKLRVSQKQEKLGLDVVKVLEEAYGGQEEDCPDHGTGTTRIQGQATRVRRSPQCAFVSPNVRLFSSTQKLDVMQLTDFEDAVTTPRVIIGAPRHIDMTTSSAVPNPPPLPHLSHSIPEIRVSNDGVDPCPLEDSTKLSSMGLDVVELRAALQQQKMRLKAMSSQLRTPSCTSLTSETSVGGLSGDSSINSGVVRRAAQTARNRGNFNYLAGQKPAEVLLSVEVGEEVESREEVVQASEVCEEEGKDMVGREDLIPTDSVRCSDI